MMALKEALMALAETCLCLAITGTLMLPRPGQRSCCRSLAP